MVGDPTRLRQILVNLIGNAIKFTARGEVLVCVTPDPDTANPGALRCAVIDTGIGIPADKLAVIFDRFSQVDASVTRQYGGTGLGLSISKRLVDLMGGRLWAESLVGRGSTFYCTVRLGIGAGPRPPAARLLADLHNLKTLVVDDNATNRMILREILTGWHAQVTEAVSGAAALAEMTRAQDAAAPYQLVLLDRRMPDMDGVQVATALHARPWQSEMAILLLTSDERALGVAQTRALGITDSLRKPIKRADLLRAIHAALGTPLPVAEPVSAGSAVAVTAARRDLRILLVDDSEQNRAVVQTFLKAMPYGLDLAENGAVAVEKCRTGHYDLILMDVQMPVMDGYTATRTIRQWEHERQLLPTPIIALTAHAFPDDLQKSRAAGCTAHLTKPIKKATLLRTILEQTKSSSAPALAPAADQAAAGVVHVDPAIVDLLPDFLDAMKKCVVAIRQAVDRSDYATVTMLGHRMKGDGGSYGFDTISTYGAALEQAAKDNDAAAIRHNIVALASYLEGVRVVTN